MNLKELLDNKQFKKKEKQPQSEWHELVEKFRERLNRDRDGVKYKKLTFGQVAKKFKDCGMGPENRQDLYLFFGNCNDANNFSSFFWWSFKKKI